MRGATISFVMPDCPMEQLATQWTDFYEISYLRIFRVGKNQVSLKSDKNNVRALYMETDICTFVVYLAQFFSEREMLQSKDCGENQNTFYSQ